RGGRRGPAPQRPPPPRGSVPAEPARPPTDTVDSSFTVSSCPCGHRAGSEASAMGRLRSKVAPQARQRYSYRGTPAAYVTPVLCGRGGAGRAAGAERPEGAGRAGGRGPAPEEEPPPRRQES